MSQYEEALATANLTIQQAKNLIRSTVKALEDKRLSSGEHIRLGMQASQLGLGILTILEDLTSEGRTDLLYVLEHSMLMLEDA